MFAFKYALESHRAGEFVGAAIALGATGARMGSQKVWDPTFLTLHLVFGIYPF